MLVPGILTSGILAAGILVAGILAAGILADRMVVGPGTQTRMGEMGFGKQELLYSHKEAMDPTFTKGYLMDFACVCLPGALPTPRADSGVVLCDDKEKITDFLEEVAGTHGASLRDFMFAHCPSVGVQLQSIAEGDSRKWDLTSFIFTLGPEGAIFNEMENKPMDKEQFDQAVVEFFADARNEDYLPATWAFLNCAEFLHVNCWLTFLQSHLAGKVKEGLEVRSPISTWGLGFVHHSRTISCRAVQNPQHHDLICGCGRAQLHIAPCRPLGAALRQLIPHVSQGIISVPTIQLDEGQRCMYGTQGISFRVKLDRVRSPLVPPQPDLDDLGLWRAFTDFRFAAGLLPSQPSRGSKLTLQSLVVSPPPGR
jgi:hypothetical protein